MTRPLTPAPSYPGLLVWRRPLRLIHWMLACAVILLVASPASSPSHAMLGYGVCLLVLARLVWAVFGQGYAHLSSYRVTGLWRQMGDLLRGTPHAYLGHSPLSSLFAGLIWGAVTGACASGVLIGLLPGMPGLVFVHAGIAILTGLLVVVHLGALLWRRARPGKLWASCMISGRQVVSKEIDIRT